MYSYGIPIPDTFYSAFALLNEHDHQRIQVTWIHMYDNMRNSIKNIDIKIYWKSGRWSGVPVIGQ